MAKKQAARRRASATTKTEAAERRRLGIAPKPKRLVKPAAPVTRKPKPKKRTNWRAIAIERKVDNDLLAAENARLKAVEQNQDQEISRRDTQLKAHEQWFANKNAYVSELQAKMASKDAELEPMKQWNASASTTLAEMEQQARTQTAETEAMKGKLAAAREGVSQARREMDNLNRDHQAAVRNIELGLNAAHKKVLAEKQRRIEELSYAPKQGWGLSAPVRLDEETREWMRSVIREEYSRWAFPKLAVDPAKPGEDRFETLLADIMRGDAEVESLRIHSSAEMMEPGHGAGFLRQGEVPAGAQEWRALGERLDAARRRRAESSGSPATPRPGENPVTPQQVIAQLISTLQMLTLLTATKIDDTALTFVIAIKDMPWFIALVGRVTPIPPNADPATVEVQSISYEPEMIQALNEFASRTQRQGVFGKYGQILSLILQIVALIKGQAAAPAT